MIITINEKNKVISRASGKIFDNAQVDNEKMFSVDDVPSVPETEELHFNPETKEFYTQEKPVTEKPTEEELKARNEARRAKAQALAWLAANDWKVNKRTLGEWSKDDERWKAYLADRAAMRAKIDEAEAILNK